MHKHHNSHNVVHVGGFSGSLCSLQVALLLWLYLFHNFLSHQRKKLLWLLRTLSSVAHVILAQTVGPLNVLVLSPRAHKHTIAAERKQIPEVFFILASLDRENVLSLRCSVRVISFSSSLCSLVIEFSQRQLKFLNRGGGGRRKIKMKIPDSKNWWSKNLAIQVGLCFTLRPHYHQTLTSLFLLT